MENKKAFVKWLKHMGIKSEAVLSAVSQVSRDAFVPEALQPYAFSDQAMPIGHGQTISQLSLVAHMTELVYQAKRHHKVLEVGTGSGYQSAILSLLFDDVYTIERIQALFSQAQERFKQLAYSNIHALFGDGFEGWPEHAPYDAIIVTAAAAKIPHCLLEQLADKGRMIIPVGLPMTEQQLLYIQKGHKNGDDFKIESLDPVAFVPMLPGKIDTHE